MFPSKVGFHVLVTAIVLHFVISQGAFDIADPSSNQEPIEQTCHESLSSSVVLAPDQSTEFPSGLNFFFFVPRSKTY